MTRFLTSVLLVFASFTSYAQPAYLIVFLNKNTAAPTLSKEEYGKLMEGHMANMHLLAKEGKLLAAGPFEGGGGIFIMSSTSVDEVKNWISSDPGIKAKRWDIEILDYKPTVRGVCPVKEPYEMTAYSFIRFDVIVSKYNVATYPDILRRHNAFVKQLVTTGNIVTAAGFGDDSGGILVAKGEFEREVIEADPGVQEGLISFEIKTLHIAKGSFCEE